MPSRYSVVNCRQLVTLAGAKGPRTGDALGEVHAISNGAFVVEDGQIVWVGKSEDVPQCEDSIDAGGRLVTPGLVDCHTHCVFGGDRIDEFGWRCEGKSYQEIAASGGGIKSTIRCTRELSESELTGVARKNIQRLINHGTTTIEIKSGYGQCPDSEARSLRAARAAAAHFGIKNFKFTLLGAHACPEEWSSPELYVNHLVRVILPECAPLADYADAFVEEKYFSKRELMPYLEAAKNAGLKLRLHVDQLTDGDGAGFAAEVGAVSADHLEQTNLAGIQAMKQAGVFPVLLPGSVLGLGLEKYPDARAMVANELPICLATDFNPGSSPVTSIAFVMALSCRRMGISPAQALVASTINPAESLDLGDRKGSIEVGKDADFVIWDATRYEELAYTMPGPDVVATFIQGNLVSTMPFLA